MSATDAPPSRPAERLGEAFASLRRRGRAFFAVFAVPAWCVAIVAGVAGTASVLWQWREATIIAVFAVLLLLAALPFVLGRYRLAAVFDLSADRVVVGQAATGRLLVKNRSGRRAPASTVELPVGPMSADFDLPRLAAEQIHDELFAIPTQRRAVLQVGPVVAVRGDPFGLLQRRQRLTAATDLYVHPKTVRIEGSAAGFVRDLEGQTTRQLTESDMSFHALREYVPGDDRRYIHWRHSARTQRLMVRQFEQTRRAHLLVVLSTRGDDYAAAEEFELAVSVVGSLGAQVLMDRQGVTASTSTRLLPAPTGRRLLDRLSGVDLERRAGSLSVTTRRLKAPAQQASVAVLVAGSGVDPRELRRAQRFLPADIRAIAVVAAPAEPTSVRRLGSLDVLSLARLDDLSTAWRRLEP